ncbi:MAG: hypothetical protein FJ125_01020 [Deltaproteobacteria bacterium]|nr:hypothetical protein [Deltaproteobacteria bacterium]
MRSAKCHGGRGTSGGPGGPGGGGAGGPSFAVFRQGTQVALPGNTLFPGAPGPGGSSSGLAGERGAGGPSS